MGSVWLLELFGRAALRRVPHRLLASRQSAHRLARTALAGRTLLPRRADGAHSPGPTELFLPDDDQVTLRFVITGEGEAAEEPLLTLQLCLKPGEELETGAGQKLELGETRVALAAEALGGWIRHHGWTLKFDPTARFVWPIRPYNPYQAAPETGLEHAVGALSVPLRLKSKSGFVRPAEQEIVFSLTAH